MLISNCELMSNVDETLKKCFIWFLKEFTIFDIAFATLTLLYCRARKWDVYDNANTCLKYMI